MTARIITNEGVEAVSDTEFFTRIFGHPPRTRKEREAERRAYFAKLREENRRELEELRDGLCKLASPELAAKFRKQWAEEDARQDQRETRRAA